MLKEEISVSEVESEDEEESAVGSAVKKKTVVEAVERKIIIANHPMTMEMFLQCMLWKLKKEERRRQDEEKEKEERRRHK